MQSVILSIRQIGVAELGQRLRNTFVADIVFLLTMRVFTLS